MEDSIKKRDQLDKSIKKLQTQIADEESKGFRSVIEEVGISYEDAIDLHFLRFYQTDQLSRILQGKMDELKIRQRTMNTGLEANFKEALANFNREHTQVIQVVEQKKQQSPIHLETSKIFFCLASSFNRFGL